MKNPLAAMLVLVAGCTGLIGAAMLPVVVNPGAGLTFVLLDAAEWASLHPAVQTENPALLTSGALRLAFACISLLVILGLSARVSRASATLVMGILFLAQLPPFEFLADRGNPNYVQQLGMAAVFLLTGALCIAWRRARWSAVPAVVCAFLGTLALVFGWLRVTALTTDFNLPTQTGIGLIVAAAGLALAGVVLLADLAGQNKTGPQPAPRPVSSGAPQKMD